MAMNEQINADADRKTMLYINVEYYLNLNESLQTQHKAHNSCVDCVSLNLIDSKFIRARARRFFWFTAYFWFLYN